MSFKNMALILGVFFLATPSWGGMLSLKNRPPFVPGEVLVRFKDGVNLADRDKVLAQGVSKMAINKNVYKIKLATGANVEAAVEGFSRDSAVSIAQPNYRYYALGCSIPTNATDEYFTSPYNWPLTIIQAPQAWSLVSWPFCPPGAGVTVAVLDTGVSRANPDLETIPSIGYDAIGAVDEQDPSCNCDCYGSPFTDQASGDVATTDDFGHGTWVSGIIAATWNGGVLTSESCGPGGQTTGMAGLAGGAVLMPIKVLDCTGSGTSDSIIAGINYALANGAKVLNMSLGGSEDPLEQEAINNALEAGCVVVAAAGNESDMPNSLSPLDYPAGYPGVISVGASDENDQVAYYSNGGEGINGQILDLVAPGGSNAPSDSFSASVSECVFSTFVCPLPSGGASNGGFLAFTDPNYGLAAGTSGAAPYVSATAALLLALHPTWTNTQITQQIINNTDSLDGNTGWNSQSGYGRLNVYKALSSSLGSGQITDYVKSFNSPNPFYVDVDLETNITLVINQPEPVQLTIYDTSGEVVLNKHFDSSQLNSNPNNPQFKSYYLSWDGKNGSGEKVKTGIYFYTVNINGQISHNKIAVIQGPK